MTKQEEIIALERKLFTFICWTDPVWMSAPLVGPSAAWSCLTDCPPPDNIHCRRILSDLLLLLPGYSAGWVMRTKPVARRLDRGESGHCLPLHTALDRGESDYSLPATVHSTGQRWVGPRPATVHSTGQMWVLPLPATEHSTGQRSVSSLPAIVHSTGLWCHTIHAAIRTCKWRHWCHCKLTHISYALLFFDFIVKWYILVPNVQYMYGNYVNL